MSTDKDWLDRLFHDHDDDPAAAAAGLREIWPDRIERADVPRASWLVNHVLGEKLGRWAEAHALLSLADPGDDRSAVLRNRAVAARLGGAPAEARALERQLAAVPGCTFAQAALVVRLGILQYQVETGPIGQGVQSLLACVTEVGSWPEFGPHVGLLAASMNNAVSGLLERSDAPGPDADYQRALNDGAALSRRLWQVAGTWRNHERADYLIALCANKTGRFGAARDAARAGLQRIEDNGEAPIDRAFLLLEVAKASRDLGDRDEAMAARAAAERIAAGFDDPGLRTWFAQRAAD